MTDQTMMAQVLMLLMAGGLAVMALSKSRGGRALNPIRAPRFLRLLGRATRRRSGGGSQ